MSAPDDTFAPVAASKVVVPIGSGKSGPADGGGQRAMKLRQFRQRPSSTNACLLEVHTSTHDPDDAVLMRLDLQRARFGADGRLEEGGERFTWRETRPIIASKSAMCRASPIHGERVICDSEAYGLIASADVVVSRRASFARPLVERRLSLSGQPWACLTSDFDRRLDPLCGGFWPTSPASDDDPGNDLDLDATSRSLLDRLASSLTDGVSVFAAMMVWASLPTFELVVTCPARSVSGLLMRRGYFKPAYSNIWVRPFCDLDSLADERAWVAKHVFEGARHLTMVKTITWRQRHAAVQA